MKLEKVTESELALEFKALDEAGGDPVMATEIMANQLLENPQMVKELLPEWAKLWAASKVRGAVKHWREKIIRRADNPGNFTESLNAAISNEFTRMMDMPLYGGKRLGDATAFEIRESANRYKATGTDLLRKARWQEAVASEAGKRMAMLRRLSDPY